MGGEGFEPPMHLSVRLIYSQGPYHSANRPKWNRRDLNPHLTACKAVALPITPRTQSGTEGTRTLNRLHAKQLRSQLRHGPYVKIKRGS